MSKAGRLGIALLAAASLTAYGCAEQDVIGGPQTGDVQTVVAQGKPTGELTISNWPLYIDKQTIPDFEEETGVSVKYIEDVNDNA